MKPLRWFTWIFVLVLVYAPAEGATQAMEPVTDTYHLTSGKITPNPVSSRTVTRTVKASLTPMPTSTAMSSPTPKPTREATSAYTPTLKPDVGPTATATPTPIGPARTPGAVYTPWPDAPLCP